MANQVAYGFMGLEDIFAQQINNVQINVIETALAQTLAEHNRQLDAILNLFTTPVTVPQERYVIPGDTRLQPVDQNGRARPIQGAASYDVGYPIFGAGSAWGTNWKTRETMTVADVNRIVNQFLIGDARWVRDHLLAAIFTNVDYVFPDDKWGNITVRSLARGEAGYIYPIISGADTGTTDTHFLATADVIATATDPFPEIITELKEHAENGTGPIIIFVPTANRAATEGLAAFVEPRDNNIVVGNASDQLLSLPDVSTPGEIFGYHRSGAFLAEWPMLPSNYLVGIRVGGDAPIGMRVSELQTFRGFRQVAERNDHPWYERQWYRELGFGARNRVGAVVKRVGNGTYAIPTVGTASTSYQAPIA